MSNRLAEKVHTVTRRASMANANTAACGLGSILFIPNSGHYGDIHPRAEMQRPNMAALRSPITAHPGPPTKSGMLRPEGISALVPAIYIL